MKITVNRTELLTALKAAGKAVGNGNAIPIIGSYLFDITKESATITGGNMSVFVSVNCNLKSDKAERVCIPAVKLQRIVSALPEQPLTMTFANDIVTIKCDTGRYSIPYQSGTDYPKVDLADGAGFSLSGGLLPDAIGKTAFAISTDDLRQNLAGLHISCTNGLLRIEATDAHVLSTMQIATESDPFDLIIPRTTIPILSGFELENVDVVYNKNLITFKTGLLVITSRLLDATFPNVDAVIPRDNPVNVAVDRLQLLAAVKRVSILADMNELLKMVVSDGTVTLTCSDVDLSQESEEVVKAVTTGELTIGLTGSQVATLLGKLEGVTAYIEGSNEKRAILFSDGSEIGTDLFLVMPMLLC